MVGRTRMLRRCLLLTVGIFIGLDDASGQHPHEVTVVVVDPQTTTTLYAGTHTDESGSGITDGGVFKSTDSGRNWTAVNSGLGEIHIRALVIDPIDPLTIYAGTRDNGVFKTADGAKTWRSVNVGLTSLAVQALAIDPVNTNVVYAGTRDAGIFKTADGG